MNTYTLFIILAVVGILSLLGIIERMNGTGLMRRVLHRRYSNHHHHHHHDYDRMSFNDDEYFS